MFNAGDRIRHKASGWEGRVKRVAGRFLNIEFENGRSEHRMASHCELVERDKQPVDAGLYEAALGLLSVVEMQASTGGGIPTRYVEKMRRALTKSTPVEPIATHAGVEAALLKDGDFLNPFLPGPSIIDAECPNCGKICAHDETLDNTQCHSCGYDSDKNPWITGRRPTKEDADENGRVVVGYKTIVGFTDPRITSWRSIDAQNPRVPWQPVPLCIRTQPVKPTCKACERYDKDVWFFVGDGSYKKERVPCCRRNEFELHGNPAYDMPGCEFKRKENE